MSYTVLPQGDVNSRDARNCCKKLSISDGGDRKKLRRLSSMARHFFSKTYTHLLSCIRMRAILLPIPRSLMPTKTTAAIDP
jgi:hypothetical protein